VSNSRKTVWLWTVILLIATTVAGVGIFSMRLIQYGLSARDQPSFVEAAIARKLRYWAIPARAKGLKDPMPANSGMLEQGRNHWADHCATCHANNGSGETEIGRSLYPKAPDMRQPETQSLTDGELYYIIRNGVRMTGMPGWGDPKDGDFDHETWMLVLFIRHLPNLSTDEQKAMERFNPKSAAEREEEEQEEDFLNGKNPRETTHDR
jgi:mono/diheme cytochrome c family protein